MKKIIVTISFVSAVAIGYSSNKLIVTYDIVSNNSELYDFTIVQDTSKTNNKKSASVKSNNAIKPTNTTSENEHNKYKVKDPKIIEQRKNEIQDKELKKERNKKPIYKEIEVKN